MSRSQLAGTRIRNSRMALGMKQAELAKACGISASYLNLIEHDRRRIGGSLLLRIAEALGAEPSAIGEGAESALLASLESAADKHDEAAAERDRADELASRFPGWARLIRMQFRESARLEQVVERLDDRLTHDPFLSASMHNVLTSVTAIRSASGILAGGEPVEPEWQRRFARNIHEDSRRLADATESLVGYLDAEADDRGTGSLPQDEVEQWLMTRGWVFEELERDAAAPIAAIVDDADEIRTLAARELAHGHLVQYAADAAAVPKASLGDALGKTEEPLALADMLDAPLPALFRRLATLAPDALPEQGAFGLVGCDASGTLVFRKPLPDFDLPRFGGACPLWPLFRAGQQPMVPVRETLAMSGRDDNLFDVHAVAEITHPLGFEGPPVVTSWMLFRQWQHGRDAGRILRAGTTCRICAETGCPSRREPAVFSTLSGEGL
ncbi:MAG: helix-turn-helix domain-containing protein [Boseongicola sp.]|nr:helix-turn-helix domain-containing protein [Boseongicola sp.]